MIYLMCFAISCISFRYLSKYKIKYGKHELSFSLAAASILLPCILAGLRAPIIGTDVHTYVISGFNRVIAYDNINDLLNKHRLELFYEGLMYLISRLTSDVHWFHFISSIIVVYGVYRFVLNFDQMLYLPVGLYTFYCLYFNQSLNLMRQWIATGIFLMAVKLMMEKKLAPYLLCSIAAVLFHSSAVILFIIYPMYQLVSENSIKDEAKDKSRKKWSIFLVICTLLMSILFEPAGRVLISIGILPTKYLHYFTDSSGTARASMILISQTPIFLSIILWGKKLIQRNNQNRTIITFLLIAFVLEMLSPKFGYASRIALYFSVWQIPFYGIVYTYLKGRMKNKESKTVFVIFFYGGLTAYWIYCYAIRNFGSTYPYVSDVFYWL